MKIASKIKLELLKNIWNKPAKVLNLASSFLMSKKSFSKFMPISADIEPTILCNLDCVMCHRKELLKDRKELSMSFENFKTIVDEIPSLLKINLQGMGEPLLAKEFFAMVRYARKKGILVTTVTNGIFMDEANCEKMIESEINRVYFSIDSNDADQYMKYRRKDSLELLKKNLENFVKIRNEKGGKTLIGIWMLLFKDNVDQIIPLVDFAKSIGVDELVVQTEIKDRGKENWKGIIGKMKADNLEEAEAKIFEAKKYAKSKKFNLGIHRGLGYLKPDHNSMCQWPWKSLYITSEGDVVPCCVISDSKVECLGNILDGNFKEIWNGNGYKNLRKNLLSGQIPSYCKGCYGKCENFHRG